MLMFPVTNRHICPLDSVQERTQSCEMKYTQLRETVRHLKQGEQDTEGKKAVIHLRSQAVADPRPLNLFTSSFSLFHPDFTWADRFKLY